MIEHTGGYQIALGDADLIRKDVIANVLGTVFGVLALFLYAFRRPAAIFYAGAPLALGLVLTFGMAGLVYGPLSSASAGFAALLAGLGIDFITVFYGRYVDERNRGATMPHAMVVTIRHTLPGIFVAAITTAATFYAFLATDFQGMTQLGFLTGTGILFFLICVAFLLPSLIVLSERKERKRAPKLFMHSFGAGKLIDISIARPAATIVIWAVFIAICGALATRVRFSDNIQDLRAKGNVGVINQEKLTKKFGTSFEFMMYVVQGKSVGRGAREDARGVEGPRSARREQDHRVVSVDLHVRAAGESAAGGDRELERGRADRFNFDRINKTFRQSLASSGFKPEAYDNYMQMFRQTLSPQGAGHDQQHRQRGHPAAHARVS